MSLHDALGGIDDESREPARVGRRTVDVTYGTSASAFRDRPLVGLAPSLVVLVPRRLEARQVVGEDVVLAVHRPLVVEVALELDDVRADPVERKKLFSGPKGSASNGIRS